jgi:sporulation protein YlmC with PRC-barrel domain
MSTVTSNPMRPGNPVLLSASTLAGDDVYNRTEDKIGRIHDIMLDMASGRIRYAVMSSGGFLGMGDRLFAIPWSALTLDADQHRFLLDVSAEKLRQAPGFDKDHWPDMADAAWAGKVESYFGSGTGQPLA